MTPTIALLTAPSLLAVSDRDKDVIPSLRSIPDLQRFIWDNSELRSLRLCNKFQSCKKVLCPWCSVRRATEARQSLAPTAHAHASVLFLRLSVATSSDLDAGWKALEDSKNLFVANRYLSSRCTSWFIQKEVTHTRYGWNLHLNFLIFDDDHNRLHALRDEAIPRWLKSTSSVGAVAAPTAQHVEIWHNPRKAAAYAVKGIMHQKKNHDSLRDGHSPGDLLALFHSGDADAADAWHELEEFLTPGHGRPRRRWIERGGALRGQSRS